MRLREWREREGLTAQEVWRRLDSQVTIGTYFNWEAGRHMPRFKELVAIQRLTQGAVTAQDCFDQSAEFAS